jgi:hypothetical protein
MVETQSDVERSRAVVRYLDRHLSTSDRLALIDWAHQLLSIRNRQATPLRKARQALLVTLRREVILTMLSSTAGSLKGLAWSDRSWSARLGLGAAAVTGAVASSKGAGIAALGGAVGVPLWVVLGAGGSFAGMLIDELSRAIPRQDLPVEGEDPTIVDAEWEPLEPTALREHHSEPKLLPSTTSGRKSLWQVFKHAYGDIRTRQRSGVDDQTPLA